MFAAFSDETKINNLIVKRDLTLRFVSAFAQHAGIPRCSFSTLSEALSGKGLRYETSKPLLALLEELDAFVSLFEPVRIHLTNGAEVYNWLQLFRSGHLRVFALHENKLVQRTSDEAQS